jgi:hypothetical protein
MSCGCPTCKPNFCLYSFYDAVLWFQLVIMKTLISHHIVSYASLRVLTASLIVSKFRCFKSPAHGFVTAPRCSDIWYSVLINFNSKEQSACSQRVLRECLASAMRCDAWHEGCYAPHLYNIAPTPEHDASPSHGHRMINAWSSHQQCIIDDT